MSARNERETRTKEMEMTGVVMRTTKSSPAGERERGEGEVRVDSQ